MPRLPAHAELILQDWFDANLEHPYPSKATLAKLVKQTRVLTLTQVRSWLQNERIRHKKGNRGGSKYRLPPKAVQILTDYFESQPLNFKISKEIAKELVLQTKLTEQQVRDWLRAARGRAKQSLQTTGVYTCKQVNKSRKSDAMCTDGSGTLTLTSMTENRPTSMAEDTDPMKLVASAADTEPSVTETKTKTKKKTKTKSKSKTKPRVDSSPSQASNRFPKQATKKLQAWFLEHLDHPYATPDEMARMAADMNISKKQVSAWLQDARYKHRRAQGLAQTKPATRLPTKGTKVLQAWFDAHIQNPYPSRDKLVELVAESGLSMASVTNWMRKARGKHKRYCEANGIEHSLRDQGSIPADAVAAMTAWVQTHRDNFVITKHDVAQLAQQTGLNDQQIKNWLKHARRQLATNDSFLSDQLVLPAEQSASLSTTAAHCTQPVSSQMLTSITASSSATLATSTSLSIPVPLSIPIPVPAPQDVINHPMPKNSFVSSSSDSALPSLPLPMPHSLPIPPLPTTASSTGPSITFVHVPAVSLE
eukprot:TRINITY_DN12286_c0_g1_i4.p1 TRINITY_DN12286_c0_g1~~TRINITY_DN12286_c0_g1_i4.p1  ORF type:complete len:535 (+),score=90.19 TRINITY_DN12286_c0_g1_i4:94-1698(+)